MANGMTFAVADYDFTKCGLIPSVIMQAKIPNTIDESFYRVNVIHETEIENSGRNRVEIGSKWSK